VLLCSQWLRNNREWPHHVIVLVFDDVTVIDVGLRRADAIRQVVLRAIFDFVSQKTPE
jgi:hypothetical protein